MPRYVLEQNYPNPFNSTTTISYQLPEVSYVTLSIYNLLGQKIRTLIDEEKQASYHSVQWDGRNEAGVAVASGVYVYVLSAGEFNDAKKMLLLR